MWAIAGLVLCGTKHSMTCDEQSPCQQLVVKPIYLYLTLNPLALVCQLACEHPSFTGVVIDVMTGGCLSLRTLR